MTPSSPGSTAVSMAAIMASVAPHDTVTSVSGSTSRPQAAACFRATAWRSCGAPHVVAYWLYPSRSACAAASRIRGSVSKSGKPWAKLIASSGPLRARFNRVISLMTDSVKLWAFCDSRRDIELVPRIAPHEVNVGARARITPLRHLEPTLPSTADIARPACGGEKIKHVGAAEQPHHLAPLDDRHAPDALADEEPRRFVDAGVLADRDDVRAHDVARDLSFLGEDVHLGDDARHMAVAADDRRPCDALARQRRRDLVDRCVLAEGDHVSRHHLFDRDHQVPSSVATVLRLALPPVRIRPTRSPCSFPEMYAARGRAPVGSSAR